MGFLFTWHVTKIYLSNIWQVLIALHDIKFYFLERKSTKKNTGYRKNKKQKDLVEFSERNWAKNHPNLPKEYMAYGLTLGCEGASWRYKDGKWQRKPKQIGLTTSGVKRLPDGLLLHYEQWINEGGKRERMEWKLPDELSK